MTLHALRRFVVVMGKLNIVEGARKSQDLVVFARVTLATLRRRFSGGAARVAISYFRMTLNTVLMRGKGGARAQGIDHRSWEWLVTGEASTLARTFRMDGVAENKTSLIVPRALLPLPQRVFRCRQCESHGLSFRRSTGREKRLIITPERTVAERGVMATPALAGVPPHVEGPSAMFRMTGETLVLVLGVCL